MTERACLLLATRFYPTTHSTAARSYSALPPDTPITPVKMPFLHMESPLWKAHYPRPFDCAIRIRCWPCMRTPKAPLGNGNQAQAFASFFIAISIEPLRKLSLRRKSTSLPLLLVIAIAVFENGASRTQQSYQVTFGMHEPMFFGISRQWHCPWKKISPQ